MSLGHQTSEDNDNSGAASGHYDDRKHPLQDGDFWTKTKYPVLAAFIQHHRLHTSSFRRIVRCVRQQGGYSRDEDAIRITRDRKVEFLLDDVQPKDDTEKQQIADEVRNADLPTSDWAMGLPDNLKQVDSANLYVCRTQHEREGLWPKRAGEEQEGRHGILFVQQRIDLPNDDKLYLPWSYWSDGKWRRKEPDDYLPLYGLHRLNGAVRVYLHEGAKAARAAQEIADELHPEHPLTKELAGTVHLGWLGGALNPGRTDWGPLKNLPHLYTVADNDEVGIDAIPKIARLVRVPMTAILPDGRFDEHWDCADDWPANVPSMASLEKPATWATDIIPSGKKGGRPAHVIRAEFAAEWIYASEPDLFINRKKPYLRYSEDTFDNEYITFSDDVKPSRLLKDVLSSKVACLAYKPGADSGIITEGDKRKFNVHVPSKVSPRQGDAKAWEEFLEQLLPIESERHEVKRWCATLIARPDIRMIYALFLASEEQGVGKSVLGRILAKLVGEHNVSFPNESDITNSVFNDYLPHKRLIVANEIYAGENHHAYNRLKPFITEPEVLVNEKFVKAYKIENNAHFIICSNNKTRALKIDDKDRRLLIARVTEEKRLSEYWDGFFDWLDNGDGYSIIAWWAKGFLHDEKNGGPVKTSDRAPMTAAKQDMLRAGWSPGKELVFELATKIKAVFDEGKLIAVGRDIVRIWLAEARCLDINDPRLEGKDLIGSTMAAAGLHLVVDVPGKETPRFKTDGCSTHIYTNYPTAPGIKWADLRSNLLTREKLKGDAWSPKM